MRKTLTLVILVLVALPGCTTGLWGSYEPFLTPEASPTGVSPTPSRTPPPPEASPLPSATPSPTATRTTLPSIAVGSPGPSSAYTTQSGDTLAVVAARYAVDPAEITSAEALPEAGMLMPGTVLFVPSRESQAPLTPAARLLPDSEVIFSPSTLAFDIQGYVQEAGGKLSTFREYQSYGWLSGAEGIERMTYGSSMNPRLLLGLVQYFTGWVEGDPAVGIDETYPLGYQEPLYPGLYQQMRLMVRELVAGYYGWRSGELLQLTFPDGTRLRLAPDLNAGTVALMYLFAQRMDYPEWQLAVDPQAGFPALYASMFGDPWERADLVEPLYPENLIQPEFTLPFEPGTLWSLTGGPHAAWEQETAWAALDFAPAMAESGCVESNAWVLAIAPGRIVRSEGGYVILDLDGDGYEQTGWVVLYMHVATKDRIPVGTWVNADDRIGHPSCEGGLATGTHLHIARKFNGEWVPAGEPLPFVLSGWTAHYGAVPYKGTLTKGEEVVTASQSGTRESNIIRDPDE